MTHNCILAISTSSGVARVAAVQDDWQVLFQFEISDYKSQSALLLPSIHDRFQQAGLQPGDVKAIAVDVGPGGFTSLRTACGVAQGLATAWDIPVVSLTSFECMLPKSTGSAENAGQAEFTVLIDARLNEIYMASFSRPSLKPVGNTPGNALDAAQGGTCWASEPGLLAVSDLATVSGRPICDRPVFELRIAAGLDAELGEVSAVRLGQLAWEELAAGRQAAPFECQPLYVRDKVAQTTSERLALKHGAV
ncbi:MAG TPA: tRNA (adenosine(37)-N6)-threonylcarbamoyltransferase complex dimerization subunit type 1 TsaB [Limnobacter sp.]|nr:tRNA (adenosine(37)-N6)-threonylcarbamoyltransferase complex dimerization subunit type 1 TsaB [Limnobacter sp.]